MALSTLEDRTYEDKDGYAYDEIKPDIKGSIPTGGMYSLKSGQITEGHFCINGYLVNYNDSKATIDSNNSKCTSESLKLVGSLKLSSNSGHYTYPEIGTIEIIENNGNGKLSCESSDTKVATCLVKGNTVTVKSGTKEGSTTLTITSEATENYNEQKLSYVAITAKGTLRSYTVAGYTGIYDSKEHGIVVTSSGSTITYSKDGTNYTNENPKYKDVGEYTVYYKIETEGYNEITGNVRVVITKAEGEMTSPTAKTLTYTESKQELINRGSSNTGTIEYKLDNGEYLTSIPKATNPGTYNVYLTPNMGYQWNDGTRKDTKLVSCTISKKNIANITISNIADQTYTTGKIKPSTTVTLDGKTLTNGSDYSLSYKNNINIG